MKKKILVVDDDHDIIQIATNPDTQWFSVKAHANGLNLPVIVKEYDPDLVLLDIRLPGGKSGTELSQPLPVGCRPPAYGAKRITSPPGNYKTNRSQNKISAMHDNE